MTKDAALEQARAIFDNAPNDLDWSAIPAIAAALLDAEANGVEWSMEYGWESLDKQHKRLRSEAAKLRVEGT